MDRKICIENLYRKMTFDGGTSRDTRKPECRTRDAPRCQSWPEKKLGVGQMQIQIQTQNNTKIQNEAENTQVLVLHIS